MSQMHQIRYPASVCPSVRQSLRWSLALSVVIITDHPSYTKLSTAGDRVLPIVTARVWNELPRHSCLHNPLRRVFCRRLKTHMFNRTLSHRTPDVPRRSALSVMVRSSTAADRPAQSYSNLSLTWPMQGQDGSSPLCQHAGGSGEGSGKWRPLRLRTVSWTAGCQDEGRSFGQQLTVECWTHRFAMNS